MRGVFIHQQLEFRLEMAKDDAAQGDSIPCVLSVNNHSNTTQTVNDLCLELGFGNAKGSPSDLSECQTLASAQIDLPWEIAPQQQKSTTWTFELDKNCPITDKSQTLIIRYGTKSGATNQLPITVATHNHIKSILQTLETSFQFVQKSEKSSKGWVEVKFKPPSGRRFSMVNDLILGFRFEAGALLLRFKFNVKRFDTSQSTVAVKKEKAEVEKRLDESQYLSGGFLNYPAIEAGLADALNVVATDV